MQWKGLRLSFNEWYPTNASVFFRQRITQIYWRGKISCIGYAITQIYVTSNYMGSGKMLLSSYLQISWLLKLMMYWALVDWVYAWKMQEHPEWEMKDGFVFFQRAKESVPCKEIPSLQLINQTLSYARELERIVWWMDGCLMTGLSPCWVDYPIGCFVSFLPFSLL